MKLLYFFLDRRRFTYLIILALVFAGLFSSVVLPKESNPEVKIPIGVVTTVYPGASAVDVERLITDEIEEEIRDLGDVDDFTSSSRESISTVIVNFDPKADMDNSIRSLRDAVADAEPSLPNDAEAPVVTQVDFEDEPVVIMGLSADVSLPELKDMADAFKEEAEKVDGISEALIAGIQDREILVNVDKRKLDQFSISISELVTAIQGANISFPIGGIETSDIRYVVRLDAEILNPEEIDNLPIKQLEGATIYVRDVADVSFDMAKAATISRISEDGQPSINAVSIYLKKTSGGDITKIVDNAFAQMEELRQSKYPDAQLSVSWNSADEIKKSLGELSRNGLTTIVIISILLFLFLGKREALLAGISIPFSFLIGFIGLLVFDLTINFLSLFSLILALGIVVDNGIIITEGMHEHIKKGRKPMDAAKKTIDEFQWPLVSGTLTTVSVFVPMLLMGGIMGEFIKHIPITVNMVLIGSLFTALALMPLIGAQIYKKFDKEKENSFKEKYINPQLEKLHNWYEAKLRALLSKKKVKRKFILGLVAAFIFSIALPITGVLKVVMFPPSDIDFFYITLEAPIGTTLEATDQIVRTIEDQLYDDERIESFFADVGRGTVFSENTTNGPHVANLTVNLFEKRNYSATEIIGDYRNKLAFITDAKVRVENVDSGPPTGAPVLISFRGDDLDVLEGLANQSADILEEIEGVIDISTSLEEAAFEFVIEVDREKAIKYGFSPIQIAQTLRTAVQGTDASSIRFGGEDIDVVVTQSLNPYSVSAETRTVTTINEIEQMVLTSPRGEEVTLDSIVNTTIEPGTNVISHTDGDREIKTTAEVSGITAREVLKQFEKQSEEFIIPGGYTMKIGGEAEDVAESFNDMFKALYIGVLLIAAILLLQFNSYRQPFFILTTLPMSLIGVLPGLALLRLDLSFPAFIGIVALSGVVVNDAIILIDKINNNRRDDMTKFEAIVKAGKSRLQPIMLTTITTIAGILPLTLSDPIWAGLGFSIIFGLLMATILTLGVIPILYLKWGEKELGS